MWGRGTSGVLAYSRFARSHAPVVDKRIPEEFIEQAQQKLRELRYGKYFR
jgi:hypothetical protein